MNTLRELGATDPGLLVVASVFLGIAIGIALVAICSAWGPRPSDQALINPSPRNRATSSNRKSGRTS